MKESCRRQGSGVDMCKEDGLARGTFFFDELYNAVGYEMFGFNEAIFWRYDEKTQAHMHANHVSRNES